MRAWFSLTSDRGGVLWGILCCWLAVIANICLLGVDVPIFYIAPIDLFGVPGVVSLVMWFLRGQVY